DRKLLQRGLLLDGLEPEPLRDKGEGFQGPSLQGRVIVLRLLERDQVAQGPGHLVAPALQIAVVTRGGAQEGGQLPRDRRLLGEHNSHGAPPSAKALKSRTGMVLDRARSSSIRLYRSARLPRRRPSRKSARVPESGLPDRPSNRPSEAGSVIPAST